MNKHIEKHSQVIKRGDETLIVPSHFVGKALDRRKNPLRGVAVPEPFGGWKMNRYVSLPGTQLACA